jgi:hypothetical protein
MLYPLQHSLTVLQTKKRKFLNEPIWPLIYESITENNFRCLTALLALAELLAQGGEIYLPGVRPR